MNQLVNLRKSQAITAVDLLTPHVIYEAPYLTQKIITQVLWQKPTA